MDPQSYEECKQQLGFAMRRLRRSHHLPQVQLGDLTVGESSVLLCIHQAGRTGECVRPNHIAHMASTTPSSLSQMLKSLEAKGYVTRERISGREGADSRGVRLQLTDEGARLAREGDAVRDGYLKELFDYLGEDDVRSFVRVVERMVAFFEDGEDGRDGRKGGLTCA